MNDAFGMEALYIAYQERVREAQKQWLGPWGKEIVTQARPRIGWKRRAARGLRALAVFLLTTARAMDGGRRFHD